MTPEKLPNPGTRPVRSVVPTRSCCSAHPHSAGWWLANGLALVHTRYPEARKLVKRTAKARGVDASRLVEFIKGGSRDSSLLLVLPPLILPRPFSFSLLISSSHVLCAGPFIDADAWPASLRYLNQFPGRDGEEVAA